MSSHVKVFAAIASNLTRIEEMRKSAVVEAFGALEQYAPEVASLLVQRFGDRRRAACWMCVVQRHLEGRTAYQALAEGDVDEVWDLLPGTEPGGVLSGQRSVASH